MTDIAESDLIRTVLPQGSVKRLARLMDAPVETARCWLYRHFPAHRRADLAAKLLAELDRQDQERARLRHHLASLLADTHE